MDLTATRPTPSAGANCDPAACDRQAARCSALITPALHAGVEQRGFGDGSVVVVALLAKGDAWGTKHRGAGAIRVAAQRLVLGGLAAFGVVAGDRRPIRPGLLPLSSAGRRAGGHNSHHQEHSRELGAHGHGGASLRPGLWRAPQVNPNSKGLSFAPF